MQSPENHRESNPSADLEVYKRRRIRTVMTPVQQRLLRKHYEDDAFPSSEMREEIADSLSMTTRSVQIWFQNQRQKEKQEKKTMMLASKRKFGEACGDGWDGLDILAKAATMIEKMCVQKSAGKIFYNDKNVEKCKLEIKETRIVLYNSNFIKKM
ncbi:hypothetical protein COBT_002191 [Conglomerata obtusa]